MFLLICTFMESVFGKNVFKSNFPLSVHKNQWKIISINYICAFIYGTYSKLLTRSFKGIFGKNDLPWAEKIELQDVSNKSKLGRITKIKGFFINSIARIQQKIKEKSRNGESFLFLWHRINVSRRLFIPEKISKDHFFVVQIIRIQFFQN